jgi:DHA1 family multidrug resistance protein-like MFS transporter
MLMNLRGLLTFDREILFLCVATALLTMGQGIAVPIVPLYADTLGVSVAQVGLVITAFGLARFLTNMPAAVLSDRFGRRSILVSGAAIAAVGNVMSGFADSLEPLLVFRFIAGVGSAAFITGAVIFISDVSGPTNRGRLMSLYQGSFLIGITAGPALGGIIAEVFGLKAPFIAVGIVSAASAVWVFSKVSETRWRSMDTGVDSASENNETSTTGSSEGTVASPVETQESTRLRGYGFMLRKDFVLIALVFAGTFFTRGGAMFTLLPLKGSRDLGLSPGEIGLLLTLPSVFTFLLLPVVGVVTDRYGRKSTIVPGVLLFSVAMLVLGVSPTVVMYGVGMVLYGIAQGLEGPAPVAYVSDVSPPRRQAVGQGAARTLGDLALLSAPPIMGLASDVWGMTSTLLWNGALMGVLGIAFWGFAGDPARQAARAARTGTTERQKPQ